MSPKEPSKPKVILSLLCFALTLLLAVALFVVTLVIALGRILGEAWLAAAIVCLALFALALIIYLAYARKAIQYLDSRMDTIYDVASAARSGYEFMRSTALRLTRSLLRH